MHANLLSDWHSHSHTPSGLRLSYLQPNRVRWPGEFGKRYTGLITSQEKLVIIKRKLQSRIPPTHLDWNCYCSWQRQGNLSHLSKTYLFFLVFIVSRCGQKRTAHYCDSEESPGNANPIKVRRRDEEWDTCTRNQLRLELNSWNDTDKQPSFCNLPLPHEPPSARTLKWSCFLLSSGIHEEPNYTRYT
jgi:hypothetical protein